MEKEFDDCFKSKGGILKFKDSKIESILKVGNILIQHIKKIYPDLPNIYFNLIASHTINASATKYDGETYFIGINVGLFYMSEDLFKKIQSCKSTDLEDCSKLNLINKSNGLEFDPFYDTTVLPFTKEDYEIASKNNFLITQFIVYHEICHILRGHVGLISEKFNLNITEANNINDQNIINIMQTLEMDADSFATNRCLNDFLLNHFPTQKYNNLETFVYHFCYSIYCFFRIFGFYSLDISKIQSKTHPEPAMRVSMILDTISTILLGKYDKEFCSSVVLKGIEAIHRAEDDLRKVTYFDNQIASVHEIYTNTKLTEYKLSIASNWKKVKPKLEKYTYSILPK